MNILQVNANYGFGSTGLIVKDIGEAIEKAGDVPFFAYQRTSEVEQHGYKVGCALDWKMHAALCRAFGSQGFYSKGATTKLLNYIDDIDPQIVHLHNLHSNFVNIEMLLKYLVDREIPVVLTLHDCWFFTGKCFHYADCGCDRFQSGCGHCPKRKAPPSSIFFDRSKHDLAKKRELLLALPCLKVVGCSDWICDEARKGFLADCDIARIYNGVDLTVFYPRDASCLRERYGIACEERVILGMADKWLNAANDGLLEKMSNIEGVRVVLMGCVGQRAKLSELGSSVIAVERIAKREEVAEHYCMADVFVNPTRADTLPTVNMESICCGTPVVTYDVGGSPELIDEDSGVVVGEGDVDGMVSAASLVLTDPFKFAACAATGKERYSKRNYDEYVNIYNGLNYRTYIHN